MKNTQDPTWPIWALLYPIIFEKRPLNAVDRVLELVVNAGALGTTPQEYLIAVRQALASQERLSEKYADLLVVRHSEEDIREYLAEIEHRLRESGY